MVRGAELLELSRSQRIRHFFLSRHPPRIRFHEFLQAGFRDCDRADARVFQMMDASWIRQGGGRELVAAREPTTRSPPTSALIKWAASSLFLRLNSLFF
jgi:hypothetical protein